jgi:hypothetical protein
MSLYDILLFLHVLGAFALVAGTTAMAPFALGLGAPALGREASARLALIGAGLSGLGTVLTLVFGLWLVGNVHYQFFRFWILAALVLWALLGYSVGEIARPARSAREGDEQARDVRVIWAVNVVGAALLLVLMVWKPGH